VCIGVSWLLLSAAYGDKLASPDITKGKEMKLVSSEVSLGKVHSGIVDDTLVISADNRRVAFVARRGAKWRVVVDGVEGKEYDIGSKDPSAALLFMLSKRTAFPYQHPRARTLLFSPDSERVAYVGRRDRKVLVVVDGQEGKEYDGIADQCLVFSPDSKRVGYMAFSFARKWQMIVDGVEGNQYDCMGEGLPYFSPDSKRLAYVAEQDGKQFVVVDDKKGNQYPWIFALSVFFSPDSRRLAYVAASDVVRPPKVGGLPVAVGGKQFVVVDGVEGKQYDRIVPIGPDENSHVLSVFFSPDSKRVAYVAEQEGQQFVVVDGIEGRRYDRVVPLRLVLPHYMRQLDRSQHFAYPPGAFESGATVFSPDSRRVAYMAHRGGKQFVVVDEVEGKDHEAIALPSVMFSPDSSRLVYMAGPSGKPFVVINGEEGKPLYDALGTLLFSPDSTRVAYVGVRGARLRGAVGGGLQLGEGGRYSLVVDGVAGSEYDMINNVTFSPDSRRVAYQAERVHKRFFVVQRRRGLVVVDGKEGNEYEGIGEATLTFGPDSKRVAYWAQRGNRSLIVLDGLEANAYDGFLRGSELVFDSANSLHGLALRENEIFRIECAIVEE
jgi:Tol biopolymer transport system component